MFWFSIFSCGIGLWFVSCKKITDGDRDVEFKVCCMVVFWSQISESRRSRGEYLCSEVDAWLGELSFSRARTASSSASVSADTLGRLKVLVAELFDGVA